MGFGEAISTNLSKITDFSGRASRPEFWWWILAVWVLNLIVQFITGGWRYDSIGILWFIGLVISIVLTLATVAVGARRLHDTNRSGWLLLLLIVAVIPCIGLIAWIVLIVFWAQAGTPGDNQYGPPPAS